MKYNQYYNITMNIKQLAKETTFYNATTNWSVIKLLNKLLVEV